MIKLGCCIDIEQVYSVCELGYDFIDLSGAELVKKSREEIEKLAEYLKQRSIPCIGIHATFPKEIKLIGDEYNPVILREYMDRLVEKAKILNVRYIGIGSPGSRQRENGVPKEMADRQMRDALGLICEQAEEFDILLESLNQEETNYINSLQEAYDLEKGVNKSNIGLVWDIYHFIKCGEKVDKISEDLLSHVKYLHIADPDGRKYPSDTSGRELFDVMEKAISLTKVEYLAVEALTKDFQTDAQQCRKILKEHL